ncbi:MAG: UTP--glucose-1-phosphate uridylyltransferase [Deltaproteobacteria bacterium]|nr:UTP--glucose-1-phosphate uridylyltransferase [Deltaproteobacteria bacterium]
MNKIVKKDYLPDFISKIKKENLDDIVIETFRHYYNQALNGETGLINDRDIQPVELDEIQELGNLDIYQDQGESTYKNAVRVVLNGGLGTSMGLTGPKSLLKVKDGQSFLNVIMKQAENSHVNLLFMNSFSTNDDTLAALARIKSPLEPKCFLQNKYPKVLQENFAPASWPPNPKLEWNPPGHGDVYTALYTSGMLQQLLAENIKYAFISNSDNLGARMDSSLLGYFAKSQIPFIMEVAEKTPSDVKGGHLAKLRKNGRFILREAAQCPKKEIVAFQKIGPYRYFNTNSIWINLDSLDQIFKKNKKILLPLILNSKTLDPRDETSPPVYQFETAMGAAISLFGKAAAVRVPRSRFFPVKTCNDLLAMRSDCFVFTEKKNLRINLEGKINQQQDTIKIKLDPKFYGKIDDFDKRFADGVPSLVDCSSLSIEGDVLFKKDVKIKGAVTIRNTHRIQVVIKEGSIIDKDLSF